MIELLGFMAEQIEQLSIPYEFGEWTGKVSYPYFVGSYDENEIRLEDGYTGGIFTLDGWSRGSKIPLVEISDKIKEKFKDLRAVRDGTAFFITSPTSQMIPTGEEDLYRISITLTTNEWKGE